MAADDGRELRHTFSLESETYDDEAEEPLTPQELRSRPPPRRLRSLDELPSAGRSVTFRAGDGKPAAESDAADAASPGASAASPRTAQRRRLLAPIRLDPAPRGSSFRLLSPIRAAFGGEPGTPQTPRTPLAASLGVAQWVELAPAILPEWAEEAELRELEELHVANARVQDLDCAEAFAASEIKYALMLLQPGLFVAYALRSAYHDGWGGGEACAASLPWWMMGSGFVGCLLLVVFCAFANGRIPFDERAYTCACCCLPYTALLAGGWVALYASRPSCGPKLYYLAFCFGVVYSAYFGVVVAALVVFGVWCERRRGQPFRGVPLAFIVIFAPLHLLMPGVPVMPLRYLWLGPRRRRRASSDEPRGDEEDPPAAPPPPVAAVAEVELLTPRSVCPVSARGSGGGGWGAPRRVQSGPLQHV